jgi:cytochrome c5
MLKPLLLSPALLLFAFLPGPGPQQKPAHKPAAAEEPATPKTINVQPARPEIKQIYKFDCAMCHGETGNGKTDLATSMTLTLGDWTNPSTLSGKSDDELYKIIRNGKDKMPPEDASRAKDDEVRGLVKYIRTFTKGAPTAEPAAEPASQPAAPAAPAATPGSPTSR